MIERQGGRERAREREREQERRGLNNLVSNKAKEIIMHSVDYKAFGLQELARTSAIHAALGLGCLRRTVACVCVCVCVCLSVCLCVYVSAHALMCVHA